MKLAKLLLTFTMIAGSIARAADITANESKQIEKQFVELMKENNALTTEELVLLSGVADIKDMPTIKLIPFIIVSEKLIAVLNSELTILDFNGDQIFSNKSVVISTMLARRDLLVSQLNQAKSTLLGK